MNEYDKIMNIINNLNQAINSYISSNNTFDSILKDNDIKSNMDKLKNNKITKESDLVSRYDELLQAIKSLSSKTSKTGEDRLESLDDIIYSKIQINDEVQKINAQTLEKIEIHELNLDQFEEPYDILDGY